MTVAGATWVSPDPMAVLATLSGVTAEGSAGTGLVVVGGPMERLQLGGPEDPAAIAGRVAGLVAVGIATVDVGRLAAALAPPLIREPAAVGSPVSPGPVEEIDEWLGARTRPVAAPLVPLVLLEPSTEGRLAGALARSGEGPLVAWVRLDAHRDRPWPSGVVQRTALGPGLIIRSGGRWGPFLIGLRGPTSPDARGATIAP